MKATELVLDLGLQSSINIVFNNHNNVVVGVVM